MRWRDVFLETSNARQRSINLLLRQCSENTMDIFDFRNAMANHGQIIPGADRESDCLFQPIAIQNCAHVEIVGHYESIKTKLVAKQICGHSSRQTGRRFFRLE